MKSFTQDFQMSSVMYALGEVPTSQSGRFSAMSPVHCFLDLRMRRGFTVDGRQRRGVALSRRTREKASTSTMALTWLASISARAEHHSAARGVLLVGADILFLPRACRAYDLTHTSLAAIQAGDVERGHTCTHSPNLVDVEAHIGRRCVSLPPILRLDCVEDSGEHGHKRVQDGWLACFCTGNAEALGDTALQCDSSRHRVGPLHEFGDVLGGAADLNVGGKRKPFFSARFRSISRISARDTPCPIALLWAKYMDSTQSSSFDTRGGVPLPG